MTVASSTAASPSRDTHGKRDTKFWSLLIGCIGVVYGDIGTSPLYAFKEAAHAVALDGILKEEIYGILSLIIWSLVIVVTLKYVLLLLRADNNGEGGILSLAALARRALGKSTAFISLFGIAGAALFFGDAAITPAISVLSAIEGLELVMPAFERYILPLAIVILIMLFHVQKVGTGKVSILFGPIMILWFVLIAAAGTAGIFKNPSVLMSFNPYYAALFLYKHGWLSFMVLGLVFLAVTGAEALYTDMGHFGRKPIQRAWLFFVFPALVLNYLGQGALVLNDFQAIENPFYLLFPEWMLLPIIGMATLATIIASQAVITGAYSMTRQAIQLGLLPRMEIRHMSAEHEGQIYMPKINNLLLYAVLLLCVMFRTSSALASAYGISVTGAIVVDSVLAFVVIWKLWKKGPFLSALIVAPFLIIELAFLSSNISKVFNGGIVPLLFSAFLGTLMFTWVAGTRYLRTQARRQSMGLGEFMEYIRENPPVLIEGNAIFLTSEPEEAPLALIQNLKFNHVMHTNNILLTVVTEPTPHVSAHERISMERISTNILRITMSFGYMQTPNVPHALGVATWQNEDVHVHDATYFLSRRKIVEDPLRGLPPWQEKLYIPLSRSAATATDFFKLPPGRVVEIGVQIGI